MAKHESRGIRRDSAEMFPLMAAYAAGDETQAAFCASAGLKEATFQYWWRKYRQATSAEATSVGFVALDPEEVLPRAISSACPLVELRVGGLEVRFWGVEAAYVAAVVEQLLGRC